MKEKILSGEFTPNTNNRNTHWDSMYNGTKYRSSWEALYQFFNPNAEYEQLRIEYEFKNSRHAYIVDFVDHKNSAVIEVKPKSLCQGDKFIAKMSALTQWAELNSYTVIIVDEYWFRQQDIKIQYDQFDENTARKIKKLYETNKKN